MILTDKMLAMVQAWQSAADQRAIFLDCYRLMTNSMFIAIPAGEFNDGLWVDRLLHRFADYYFDALDLYNQHSEETPIVWQLAHDATRQPETWVLQNLLLGVNAHINYDLVLTLVDMLDGEWTDLSAEKRQQRYADHCHVNDVIGRTIDRVQDEVIEQHEPAMNWMDTLLGPVDEWLTSQLITRWREEVWHNAAAMLDIHRPDEREALRQQIEAEAVRRANALLLNDGPSAMKSLF